MSYTIFLISNKPESYPLIQSSIAPEKIHYFDGTNYPSFSKLVNSCVASSPTETVIISSSKVRPTQSDVQKIISLLEKGYGFVGLYRFGFFGIKKELFRRIGMMDERFLGGWYEDDDFYIRLVESKIPMYVTEEVQYIPSQSGWSHHEASKWFIKKWSPLESPGIITRKIAEEKYDYRLGESQTVEYLPFEKSYVSCSHPKKYINASILTIDRDNLQINNILPECDFKIHRQSSNSWDYSMSRGYVGGKFSVNNLSNGYHGILKQWWDHYGKNNQWLLISENNAVKSEFKLVYPDITFTTLDFYDNMGEEVDVRMNLCTHWDKDVTFKYDVIICQATFEHLYDPVTALKNLSMSLNTGGHIFIHTHVPGFPYHPWPRDYFRFNPDWFIDAEKFVDDVALRELAVVKNHIFSVFEKN